METFSFCWLQVNGPIAWGKGREACKWGWGLYVEVYGMFSEFIYSI